MHWDHDESQQELLAFARRVVRLRQEHPVFRRRRFFAGDVTPDDDQVGDIAWFAANGDQMQDSDWGSAKTLMVFVNGEGIPEPGRRGEPVVDDSFLIAFNADSQSTKFTIPDEVYGEGWSIALDTHDDAVGSLSVFDEPVALLPGLEFDVADHSVVVLRRPRNGR
jgi:glycogen operon protein